MKNAIDNNEEYIKNENMSLEFKLFMEKSKFDSLFFFEALIVVELFLGTNRVGKKMDKFLSNIVAAQKLTCVLRENLTVLVN